MRNQIVKSLVNSVVAVMVFACVIPSSSPRAEGLIVVPPEARIGNSKRYDSWQQRARRHDKSASTANNAPSSDHLYRFIDQLLGYSSPRNKSLRATVKYVARPLPSAAPAAALPVGTATPISDTSTSPVTTASLGSTEPTSAIATTGIPTAPAISFAAEKAQAGFDLIKLEMAGRTYNEPHMPGERVFETHPEWRVLERSQEALEPAERAAADAAGFVANAYVNDTTRTIVVAIAGSQDLRRHLITSDIWQALIKAESPQQFYMAKSYVRSVMTRYQANGYTTECVGHSLGGGACAYVATELGLRALVVNPIAAGKLQPDARSFVSNYVVDGDLAQRVYTARGNEFAGDLMIISDGQDDRRQRIVDLYGPLSGPILLIRSLPDSLRAHRIDTALDQIGQFAETRRPR